MDSTRALLDELMGKDRNLLPNEKPKKNLHFTDPEVCKYFLCGFCPNELFTNTKSDLGPCLKIHDATCREEFKKYPDKHRFPYEDEFVEYLERLVSELDKRIKRGHERLDHQNDLPQVPLSEENREKVDALAERISSLVKQMEDLGEEGKVEESQALMQQVDQLKFERELLLRSGEVRSITQQEKRMKVCDICGAFLVIGDTDKRTASHLEGKQHQGYLKIRSALDEYQSKEMDRLKEKELHASKEKDYSRDILKESDRDRARDRSSSRGTRSRERDRDRDSDRSRDRDHHRSRDRSRDRSRERRSSNRSSLGSSRRSRSRSRSRDRRSNHDDKRKDSSKKKKDRQEDEEGLIRDSD